ncbi:hypothetical protein BDP27DRAFT_1384085 [Rhodocollybia butyracea]|uniref:RNase H type-1 domain-containing protein n=1 Tax=Rhodocollybia butyracea TaxID=206335 RepID=A0A9P5PR98_9AGAR|nr:hypothetical protein BDP27DRAFT_1384085 [Rhodocollybia butyracea]
MWYKDKTLSYAAGFASNFSEQNPDITHWQFFSDSAASIQSIFDTSPKSGQLYCSNFYHKMVVFLEADPSHTVEIAWTSSHTGIIGNKRADKLAKAGTELASEVAWNRSQSNVICMNRKCAEMEWQKQWTNWSVFGCFAIANQIPPSLKPTERLKSTKQETHEHILWACPWYAQHRHILQKVSKDVSLSDILGTEKGISALINFLKTTSAFTRDGMKRNPPQEPEQ